MSQRLRIHKAKASGTGPICRVPRGGNYLLTTIPGEVTCFACMRHRNIAQRATMPKQPPEIPFTKCPVCGINVELKRNTHRAPTLLAHIATHPHSGATHHCAGSHKTETEAKEIRAQLDAARK